MCIRDRVLDLDFQRSLSDRRKEDIATYDNEPKYEVIQTDISNVDVYKRQELVDTVMKRKTLPLEDALYYIYSSNLYKALLDENTKLWYSSTLSL